MTTRLTFKDAAIYAVVTIFAAVTRLVGLTWASDSNNGPIFDENHYAPQAYQFLERSPDVTALLTGSNPDNPGYGLIVHPPLSKELISLGMYFFGYTPLGWRIASAVAGVATAVIVVAVVRHIALSLNTSPTFRYVAMGVSGTLVSTEGVLLVSSRVAMLDIFLTCFIVLSVYFLLRDREQIVQRWENYVPLDAPTTYRELLGPRLGIRWYRLLAGLSLGLALGVKWSALYVMAAVGIVLVVHSYLLRKKYLPKGSKPLLGTLVFDSVSSFIAVVVVPVLTLLFSWRGWFMSETSVYRHTVPEKTLANEAWAAFLPDSFIAWLDYQKSTLAFHTQLTTSAGNVHPWESKPWHWLYAGKPMVYQDIESSACEGCRHLVMLYGNPFVWWLTVPAVIAAVVIGVKTKQGVWLIPALGFVATWVPWAIGSDRQMYFFYATPLVPFIVVALSLIAASVMALKPGKLATALKTITVIWFVLVVAAFIVLIPIFYGVPISNSYLDATHITEILS